MQISAQQLAMDIVVMSGLRPLDTAAIRWRPSSSATVMAVSVMVNFSRSVLQVTSASKCQDAKKLNCRLELSQQQIWMFLSPFMCLYCRRFIL